MKIPRVMAVFENTHSTLKAEKALKEAGLDVRTAMKPAGVSPGCQMALTLPEASMGRAVQTLVEKNMRAPLFFKSADNGRWEQVEED